MMYLYGSPGNCNLSPQRPLSLHTPWLHPLLSKQRCDSNCQATFRGAQGSPRQQPLLGQWKTCVRLLCPLACPSSGRVSLPCRLSTRPSRFPRIKPAKAWHHFRQPFENLSLSGTLQNECYCSRFKSPFFPLFLFKQTFIADLLLSQSCPRF